MVTLEEQEEVTRQGSLGLWTQLRRFGLIGIPVCSDPLGEAFWNDSEAVVACNFYRKESAKLDRLRHPERIRVSNKTWRHNHPGKVSEARHRRRANLSETEGAFSAEEFCELCSEFDGRCAYCSQAAEEVGPLIPDHMTPLSRGGTDFIWNIIPACKSCNSSKGNKTVEEFLAGLEALDGLKASLPSLPLKLKGGLTSSGHYY